MKIKKIVFYIIFAFVIFTPFCVVNAADVEYDFNFKTSKENMTDDDYLNQIKVCGYNAMINYGNYKNTHSVIEDYNEFYLNHGYFVARDSNNEYSIFYVLDSDYLEMSTLYVTTSDLNSTLHNRFFMGVFYQYQATMNNNGQCTVTNYSYSKNFYSFVDSNINNTDFIYDYHIKDLEITNKNLPDFYYPILATNRNFKFVNSSSDSVKREIKKVTSYTKDDIYLTDIVIKSLNSKIGNIFRHPYSSEETEKETTNKTSTVFSVNSSNYTTLKLKYKLNTSLKKDWYWWTNPWSYGDDKVKQTADYLSIDVSSSNSITYPRRFTGYLNGSEIDYTKESNDFGSVVSSTKFKTYIKSLGARNGATEGYFYFDLSSLEENTIVTIYLEYDSRYVEFESIKLPVTNFTEYDLTGKYAVALVPKFVQSNNKFPLLYVGSFITYYAFNNDTFNVYDSETLNATEYQKKILSFSTFTNTEIYERPVFYLLNNYYTDTTKVSKIKYNSSYFELLVYDTADSVVKSSYNNFDYNSPSSDFKSNNSGINGSNDSSNSNNIDLSLTGLFSQLPSLISGLGSAFTVLGQCITIAFSSLPEMVQAVLYVTLIVTIIIVAIKLIK